MKILLFILLPFTLFAQFQSSISHITPKVYKRMQLGGSYKQGCPLGLEALSYVQVSYKDFTGNTKLGELIVHKKLAKEVVGIFKTLYTLNYPIRQMRLVSDFKAK